MTGTRTRHKQDPYRFFRKETGGFVSIGIGQSYKNQEYDTVHDEICEVSILGRIRNVDDSSSMVIKEVQYLLL